MMKTIRGMTGMVVLLALLVGVPALLVRLVGNPYPRGGLAEVGMLSDAAILGLLACLGWVLWAQMTACVLWEIPAALRGSPAARLPVTWPGQQHAARILVNSVLAIGLTTAWTASPPPPAQAMNSAPVPAGQWAPVTAPDTPPPVVPHPVGPDPVAVPVTAGDTLWGLAEKHLGAGERWREIAELNRGRVMSDGTRFATADTLRPGWMIRLPTAPPSHPPPGDEGDETVLVQPGDSLWRIAEERLGDGARWPEVYEPNRRTLGSDPDLILPGQVLRVPTPDPGPQDAPGVDGPTTPTTPPDTSPPSIERPTPRGADPGTGSEPLQRGPVHQTPSHPGAHTPPGPQRDKAAAPSRDENGPAGSADAVDRGDTQDGITALRAVLASGVCLAAGALALLTAHRRRQYRARRSGRSIAATPTDLVAVERAIREAGSEAMATTDFLDLALRHLAASQRVSVTALPQVGAVVLGASELEVLFSRPVVGDAPDGWTASATGHGWTLPRDTLLEDELRQQPAPYPALVSVGVDADGRTWLLDLEATGVCGIAGPGARVQDLVRFLCAELAVNPWSEGTEVLLVGGFATETVGLNPSRLQEVDVETATRRVAREAQGSTESAEHPALDVLELRRDAVAIDSTGPLVVVGPVPPDLRVAETVRRDGRSRVVLVIQTNEMPTIELTDDGRADLPAWGVNLDPLVVAVDQARAMAELMDTLRRTEDQPMPSTVASTPTSLRTTVDGALHTELTTPRSAQGGDPHSLLPDADEVYLATAATTTEDLAALAPSVPAAVRAEVEALDPGLDHDLACWRDPTSRRPRVQVMGPVDVAAWGERREEVTNLGGTVEFIVFLTCQEHGVTPDRTAVALGWSGATVHNRARDARRLLGDRPDGDPWLPEATKSPRARHRGIATYELHPDVLVAADLFRRLRLRAQARGADGLEDLQAALSLVTGRPFDRLRRRGYGWLAENPLDHHLCHAVVDVAHLVVDRCLASGDTDTARRACEIAIKAAPDEDKPRLDLVAVTAAQGSGSVDDLVAEQTLDRVDADPTARTERVLDQRRWLAG